MVYRKVSPLNDLETETVVLGDSLAKGSGGTFAEKKEPPKVYPGDDINQIILEATRGK